MDTTETYTKMCEKAGEIQAQRQVLAFVPHGDDSICWCGADTYSDGKDGAIWLPRQDQLQEMAVLDTHDLLGNLEYFYRWAIQWTSSGQGNTTATWQQGGTFTSMEQLWLAFVMKEKYNKTWNGEEWIQA